MKADEKKREKLMTMVESADFELRNDQALVQYATGVTLSAG
jgi:hypothetical protein